MLVSVAQLPFCIMSMVVVHTVRWERSHTMLLASPTGWTTTENKGKCTVSITGGTIGTTGDNNGMVFGSSRVILKAILKRILMSIRWLGYDDTDVTIGTQSSETKVLLLRALSMVVVRMATTSTMPRRK